MLIKARLGEIKGKRLLGKSEENELLKGGYLRRKGGQLRLTPAARKQVKVVMTGGAFDLIHLGHVHALEKARGMGDLLVVAVAHDITVGRTKGRKPLHTARQRAELLEKLRCVDAALVGHPRDRMVTARRVRPDVVVFGYDQKADMKLRAEVRKLRSRRRGKGFKTTNIMQDM